MSLQLNIDPKKQDDIYYRYKMSAVTTKIEGSGNGIKTVIPNISDICKALHRPEEVLLKFLGNELGALSNYIKTDNKYLIMGSHTLSRVQEIIFKFIERYILCGECRNPETDVILSSGKHSKITLECRACSRKTMPSIADRTYNFFFMYHQNYKPAPVTTSTTTTTGTAPTNAIPKESEITEKSHQKRKKRKTKPECTASDAKAQEIESIGEEKVNPIIVLADIISSDAYVVENAALSVFRMKTEYNFKDNNMYRMVFRASIYSVCGLLESEYKGKTIPKFIASLYLHLPLLKRFFAEKEEAAKILVREVQLVCSKFNCPEKFMMALKMLVEEDIITVKDVFYWYDGKAKDVDNKFFNELKVISKPFIDWLQP